MVAAEIADRLALGPNRDRDVTIGRMRGAPVPLPDGGEGWITVHPSYLLRIPERDRADAEFERFVADLKAIRAHVAARA
ncbi:MAG: hypothetical protein H7X93_03810 [Sphingomonadaceae bacterium]|nr:hypothetical protein [Sphingomonadaceae bacterium]